MVIHKKIFFLECITSFFNPWLLIIVFLFYFTAMDTWHGNGKKAFAATCILLCSQDFTKFYLSLD